jgi:hypothetical protein
MFKVYSSAPVVTKVACWLMVAAAFLFVAMLLLTQAHP